MSGELAKVSRQIAELEARMMQEAPVGGDVPAMPPKLELVSDKATKKGVFTLGTKSGQKHVLGEDAEVVYVHEGAEVRTLMADSDERPRCAAVDGRPVVADPRAPTCFRCRYDTWERNAAGKNERYRDDEGLRCRVKRHVVVNVLIRDGHGLPQTWVPATLVVPPASLGAERGYKSDLKAMGRLQGRGTLATALTKLGWEWQKNGKFEFASLTFESLGLASAQVPEELWLMHLQDALAMRQAIADGLKHEPHDDVEAQREFERGGRGVEVSAEDGSDDEAPF